MHQTWSILHIKTLLSENTIQKCFKLEIDKGRCREKDNQSINQFLTLKGLIARMFFDVFEKVLLAKL